MQLRRFDMIDDFAYDSQPDAEIDLQSIGQVLTPTRRGYDRDWSVEGKQALCVLRRWYNNPWDETVQALSKCFAKATVVRRQPNLRKGMCISKYYSSDSACNAVCLQVSFEDGGGVFAERRRQWEQ